MYDYSFPVRAALRSFLAAALLAIVPALASAQSIAGVVRDASGAVLPGVTVEAGSPALIEKVRSTVSDGSGQYRLDSLVSGTYSVTYTLPGFSTVKRDGVQVQTGVTLTLNAELRVGGVQETITVTGETPVVDLQNSTRVQTVLSDEVLAALPASRGYGNLLAVSSGIQSNGTQSGGTNPGMIFFTSRGGRSNEGTVQIDGMNVGSAFNGGGVAGFGYDTVNAIVAGSASGMASPSARIRAKNSLGGWTCRPSASLICVVAMSRAMPFVKPTTTGRGMNFTAWPSPVTARNTRMTPAIIVTIIRPEGPCAAMMPATMTTKAPVGPPI